MKESHGFPCVVQGLIVSVSKGESMNTSGKGEGEIKDPTNATLIQRIDITSRLAIFRVRPDEELQFESGQFTVLGLTHASARCADADPHPVDPAKADRLIRRAYSISSGSNQKEFIEFYITLVGSGQLTPRLFHLKQGDRLFMGLKATGVFTLDQVPAGKNLLLVGTGTGLAPYMSMVRTLSLGEGCPVRPMAVLHGARYSWDLGYRAELESLSQVCGGFNYLPVVSRLGDDPSWNGMRGRLNELLESPELPTHIGFDLNPGTCHIFLCGNPGMVEEAIITLQGRGFDLGSRKEPGNLHVEKYW